MKEISETQNMKILGSSNRKLYAVLAGIGIVIIFSLWEFNIIISSSIVHPPRVLSNFISNAPYYLWSKQVLQLYGLWNYRNYSDSTIDKLSVLGRRLFMNEDVGTESEKKFLIYFFKYGEKVERRLMKQYGKNFIEPFGKCSVKNCDITYQRKDFEKADAVIFHLHLLNDPIETLKRPSTQQVWVWLSDESPYNTMMVNKNKDLAQYDGLFNWSMTYRSTSDVPVPYGRTVPRRNAFNTRSEDVSDIYHSKNQTVAIMSSVCSGKNMRWDYVRELQKYMQVDTYGGCGTLKCPGHFTKDCPLLNSYKFYLAFENSNCFEYITEKVWWNALEKKSVPVVLGASRKEYEQLLPPKSFIYAEDFHTPQELAKYLMYLSGNEAAYTAYHQWRNLFSVVNEHGYFQSSNFHYCRLCEALNYNERKPKIYNSMKDFWDIRRDCYPNVWMDNLIKYSP